MGEGRIETTTQNGEAAMVVMSGWDLGSAMLPDRSHMLPDSHCLQSAALSRYFAIRHGGRSGSCST